ncbi:cation:proton antiporter [Salimicrobium halophilum]|uniref:Sodium/proton antiporter, CPA1 family n=1 Tax=Salimicrobium halophilum TaxID=86666 RepID=A0A1G8T0T4_9BACI|nr:sodium:proton antiporter [Salimicrobium halophilum]SDJ35057.1 sodium/proton antiporter, CPA1 family [Salimicrobium halophilum]
MSVTQGVLLLLIGYIVFTIDKKKKNVPVPVLLLIIGIGLSFIPYFSSIEVTERMIYDLFLPGILFVSAYKYSTKAIQRHAPVLGTLSTVGLVAMALLLGLFIYGIAGWFESITLLGAMLIASILTPTDPVSAVSVLEEAADEQIAEVVDGESMINDGTSIVLFTVLAGIYTGERSFDLFSFLGEFLYVSIGGVVVGVLFGWVCSKAVHITHHRDYQVMLSIIIAYGSFHAAEHIGVSGVLGTVAAGIMLSYEFDHTNKEDHFREALSGFWNVVEPSLLALIFLLIGIAITPYLASAYWGLAILILIASIAIRFLIVSLVLKVFRRWRRLETTKQAFLVSWAGIRGTMSVFLILSLHARSPEEAGALLSISFSVVFLSLVIQSVGVYPLSKWLE